MNAVAVTDSSPSGLVSVEAEIAAACKAAGRERGAVELVAVSKTFARDAIEPVLRAGQRCFGENRVQEAKAKWPEILRDYPGTTLHLIGPLQSNKAREAVALFDAIHSVDRPSICEALAKEIEKQGRHPLLLVQINTGEEPQKAGVVPGAAGELVRFCRDELGLDVAGLMCIPPVEAEPAVHFKRLAELAREFGLSALSMGMSADFEAAVAVGATHVRVGSLIFGERPARPR